MKRKLQAAFLAVVAAVSLSACSACNDDADVASENLSKAADNFEIQRRVIVINTINNSTLLLIEGRCSIKDEGNQLEVTCKSGRDFIKNFVGLSPHVTYLLEQLVGVNVSVDHYRRSVKPEAVIPDFQKQ